MGKRVRSAKGEMVDFDILKIKEGLANAPKPLEVRERQDFIENRLHRKLKTAPVTADIDVSQKLPEPEDGLVEAMNLADDTAPVLSEDELDSKEEKKITTQKARKKATPVKNTDI